MKRMVDLDEVQFFAYLAYQTDLEPEDLLRIFLELGLSHNYIPLVNCRDCKHYIDGGYCKHYDCEKSPSDYCSDGDDSSILLC